MKTSTRVTLGVSGAALLAVGIAVPLVTTAGPSTPPTALAVVQADGYTQGTYQDTPAQVAAQSGGAAGDFTSAAAGYNSTGGAEVVILMSPAGEKLIDQAGAGALQAQTPTGVTVTVSGNIIRMTGTETAVSQLGFNNS